MLTTDGYKKAKDIQINDYLLTASFDNLPAHDSNCSQGHITTECIIKVAAWRDLFMANPSTLESKVTNIFKQTKSSFMRINNNSKYDLSLVEQPLVKRGSEYMFPEVTGLEVGDELYNYDDPSNPIVIDSLDIIEEDLEVFLFYREPWGLVVAGSMLAYNGCETSNEFIEIQDEHHFDEEVNTESQDI